MASRFATRVIERKKVEQMPTEEGTSCKLLNVKQPGTREIWAIGGKYIHKNRGFFSGSQLEAANLEIVRAQTTIPCPNILATWREDDRLLSIEERLVGKSLENIFFDVTSEDISRIGHQLGCFLPQLRKVTSPTMSNVDGSPVVDFRLFKPLNDSVAATLKYEACQTDDDVRRQLSYAIMDTLNSTQLKAFMERMPSAKPFTFSHADIHAGNIMVNNGNFVALIDWELAGFYPVWWDFVNGNAAICDMFPPELKYADALEWFTVYHAVREHPKEQATAHKLNSYMGWP
ncbi:kinase-like domain-containing protein [Camillea tinctor]|nr:kinase-like domain-containing protein [Camillea tinctor]